MTAAVFQKSRFRRGRTRPVAPDMTGATEHPTCQRGRPMRYADAALDALPMTLD
jgi:hypothetical protein